AAEDMVDPAIFGAHAPAVGDEKVRFQPTAGALVYPPCQADDERQKLVHVVVVMLAEANPGEPMAEAVLLGQVDERGHVIAELRSPEIPVLGRRLLWKPQPLMHQELD